MPCVRHGSVKANVQEGAAVDIGICIVIGVLIVLVLVYRVAATCSRPRIRILGGVLTADTMPQFAILTLGLRLRRAVVDPRLRAVHIIERYGWIVRKVRHIPFEVIVAVEFRYRNAVPLANDDGSGPRWDLFTVGLRLPQDKSIELCRFSGPAGNAPEPPAAGIPTEAPRDWPPEPSHELESRRYAEAISAMIRVPLENPPSPRDRR